MQSAIVIFTKSTKVTQQQVLIGGTLFHLLPDIAEGSTDQLNQVLTSVVLIVISLMVTLDAVFELSHRKNNESNKVNPNTELPTVSSVHYTMLWLLRNFQFQLRVLPLILRILSTERQTVPCSCSRSLIRPS